MRKPETPVKSSFREAGMMVTCAQQGSGKSHQNKLLICQYVKDKVSTKVRGRKVLILDVNGEYGSESFGKDGIPNLDVKKIAVRDVKDWSYSDVVEVRRIDMKSLSIEDKLKILKYVMSVVRNLLIILEDINVICLDMGQMRELTSTIVNLRHKAVDVIVSYQSLRAVEPRILTNCRYVRMHYQSGSTKEVKGKLGEPDVFFIAQQIINKRYYTGDKRFFLYVHTAPYKIEGLFSKEEYMDACRAFLLAHKNRLKEEMDISGVSMEEAIKNQSEQLYLQYYGNKDKDK